MRAVRGEDIGPQHQQTDSRDRNSRCWQIAQIGDDMMIGQVRMVEADIRIFDWQISRGAMPISARCIAADHEPDHLFDVVVRPAQPILHAQEPSAQILRLARDQFQDFRQTAQRLHLLGTTLRRGLGRSAQLFHQRHCTTGGLGHVQVTHTGHLDDFSISDDADHRIAAIATRLQGRQDCFHMLFKEKNVGNDDVALCNSLLCLRQGIRAFCPFRRCKYLHFQTRKVGCQPGRYTQGRTSSVLIQRDNHHAVRFMNYLIAHNGPLLHTGYQG